MIGRMMLAIRFLIRVASGIAIYLRLGILVLILSGSIALGLMYRPNGYSIPKPPIAVHWLEVLASSPGVHASVPVAVVGSRYLAFELKVNVSSRARDARLFVNVSNIEMRRHVDSHMVIGPWHVAPMKVRDLYWLGRVLKLKTGFHHEYTMRITYNECLCAAASGPYIAIAPMVLSSDLIAPPGIGSVSVAWNAPERPGNGIYYEVGLTSITSDIVNLKGVTASSNLSLVSAYPRPLNPSPYVYVWKDISLAIGRSSPNATLLQLNAKDSLDSRAYYASIAFGAFGAGVLLLAPEISELAKIRRERKDLDHKSRTENNVPADRPAVVASHTSNRHYSEYARQSTESHERTRRPSAYRVLQGAVTGVLVAGVIRGVYKAWKKKF